MNIPCFVARKQSGYFWKGFKKQPSIGRLKSPVCKWIQKVNTENINQQKEKQNESRMEILNLGMGFEIHTLLELNKKAQNNERILCVWEGESKESAGRLFGTSSIN